MQTVYSILGEIRIFSRMRKNGLIPTEGGHALKESHVRILWATWHVATAFGWGFAVILLWLSFPSTDQSIKEFIARTTLVSMLAASLSVLIGTKGKHPGWLGLLGVAVFVWLG